MLAYLFKSSEFTQTVVKFLYSFFPLLHVFMQISTAVSFKILIYLETVNSEACFCCVSRRVVVSAVRCAACGGGANKLIRALSLPAPAAPDAAAAGAAAGPGSTAASGDRPPRDKTQQQPRQQWQHHPSTQHSNCQHRHCGRKQSLVLNSQLTVPISTVSVAKQAVLERQHFFFCFFVSHGHSLSVML